MKKTILVFVSLLLLGAVMIVPALANNKQTGQKPITLPAQAKLVAPGVYSLGTALDKASGKVVEGYAFVFKKAKPEKPGKPGATTCYGFLGKDTRWRGTPEPWLVNPSNNDGVADSLVFATISNGIGKWEDAADGTVSNALSKDILGDGAITTSILSADFTSPDGNNEVYFGNIADINTIAVTVVWGVFSGPLAGRQIFEWDQVYNDGNYTWGDATVNSALMDFDNIATHELGHSVGLDDIYTSGCSDVTMYGYANNGETNKQTLETPDILGVSKLYQ